MPEKTDLRLDGKIETAIEVAIEDAIHRMFDEVVPLDAVLAGDPEPEAEPSHIVRDEATLVVMEQRARTVSTPPPIDQSVDDLFDDPDIDDDHDVKRDAVDLFAEQLREQAEVLGAAPEPIEADPDTAQRPAPPPPPSGRPRLIVVAESATPIAAPTLELAPSVIDDPDSTGDEDDDEGALDASAEHVDALFPSRTGAGTPAQVLGSASGRVRETGSGLIDMKSMARAYRQSSTGAERSRDDSDPVPLPGVVPSVVPILIPSEPATRTLDRKWAVIMLSLAAAALVAATVAVTLLVVGPAGRGDPVVAAAPIERETSAGMAASRDPIATTAEASSIGTDPRAGTEAAAGAPSAPLPQLTVTADHDDDDDDRDRDSRDRRRRGDDDDDDRDRDSRSSRTSAGGGALVASGPGPAETPAAGGDEPTEAADAPPPAPAKPDPVGAEQGCDEVGCLVEPNRECCKQAGAAQNAAEDRSAFPSTLSRGDLDTGMAAVKGRIEACGTKHEFRGVALLKLRVTEAGKVKRVSVKEGPSEFRRCVAGAAKKAAFPKTQEGGTFPYPVTFR